MIRSITLRNANLTPAVFESAVRGLLEQDMVAVRRLTDHYEFNLKGKFNLMHSTMQGLNYIQENKLHDANKLYTETILYLKTGMPLGTTSDSFADVAGTMNDHGTCLARLNQFDDALSLVKRALHMSKKSYRKDSHLVSCLEGNYLEIMRSKLASSSVDAGIDEALSKAKALLISLNNSKNDVKSSYSRPEHEILGPWSKNIFSSLRTAQLYFIVGKTVASLGQHRARVQESLIYYNTGCQVLFNSLRYIQEHTSPCNGVDGYTCVRNLIHREILDVANMLASSEGASKSSSALGGKDYLKALTEVICPVDQAMEWGSSPDELKARSFCLTESVIPDDPTDATPVGLLGLALLDAEFHLT